MAGFRMCRRCAGEYEDPHDRRFHAQPIACPDCGPRLRLLDASGGLLAGGGGVRAPREGRIVAVKGLGGYHLACDATSPEAVRRLRERKKRDEKPFAVMIGDLGDAERLAFVGQEEERLLLSVERPIVLLRRRPGAWLAGEVAPGNPLVGLLLPYAPLHHLLLAQVGRPLVMTSGNLSEEPMASRDEEARERLGGIADPFLSPDPEIQK